MATIVLYAKQLNMMPGMFTDTKQTVIDYREELTALQKKTLTINKSICNLEDVISSVQVSSRIQEEKSASLDTFQQKSEEFTADAARIDGIVADVVNQRKNDFYDIYRYLKPKCEKSGWENLKDDFKNAGAWCKEHWKLIVTGFLVAAAVILLCTGVGGPFAAILLGACKGMLAGALAGGLMGGISSLAAGGTFLEGLEEGAFTGALSGALFGGIGGAGRMLGAAGKLGTACKALEKWGKAVKIAGGVSVGMGGFDLLAWGIGLYAPENALVLFNQKLHTSFLYNTIQIGVTAVAVFSLGAYQGLRNRNPVCFIAGTMILTEAGYLAIEKIKAGDRVMAVNAETFETGLKTVVETYIRKTRKIVHLTIQGKLISTTENHPFYVRGRGFREAGELSAGEELINAEGNPLVIEEKKVEFLKEKVTVYNFQVEDFHTYYVGEPGVLVHNADYGAEAGSNPEIQLPENDSQLKHIFRDAEGHMPDTPENRSVVLEVANNSDNFLGTDARGNGWYAKIGDDGTQIWVRVRNGRIDNAGINTTSRIWDSKTGLYNNINS